MNLLTDFEVEKSLLIFYDLFPTNIHNIVTITKTQIEYIYNKISEDNEIYLLNDIIAIKYLLECFEIENNLDAIEINFIKFSKDIKQHRNIEEKIIIENLYGKNITFMNILNKRIRSLSICSKFKYLVINNIKIIDPKLLYKHYCNKQNEIMKNYMIKIFEKINMNGFEFNYLDI